MFLNLYLCVSGFVFLVSVHLFWQRQDCFLLNQPDFTDKKRLLHQTKAQDSILFAWIFVFVHLYICIFFNNERRFYPRRWPSLFAYLYLLTQFFLGNWGLCGLWPLDTCHHATQGLFCISLYYYRLAAWCVLCVRIILFSSQFAKPVSSHLYTCKPLKGRWIFTIGKIETEKTFCN